MTPYADRARRWRAEGGKVMGWLGEGVPEALIAAAGYLPFRVAADRGADPSVLDRSVYPVVSKTLSSRGMFDAEHSKLILAMLVGGRLDFLDGLLVARGRSSDTLVYDLLRDLGRRRPELALPALYLLDRPRVASYDASAYTRASIKALAEELGATDFDTAIASYNTRAELLAGLLGRRREMTLSGAEALAVLARCWTSPTEEAIALISSHAVGAPRMGRRLYITGSAIDAPSFYETIEADGVTIVGESHAWGAGAAVVPIAIDLDPIDALAEAVVHAPASFRFPLERQVGDIVAEARSLEVDAAIVYVERGDESAAFEAPSLIAAFAAAGISALHLAEQRYGDADSVAAKIGTFLSEHPR